MKKPRTRKQPTRTGNAAAARLVTIAEYSGIALEEARAQELLPRFEEMLERVRRSEAAAERSLEPAHVLLLEYLNL